MTGGTWRIRVTAIAAAAVILAAGLAVRLLSGGAGALDGSTALAQNAGTALYAALIYAGVVVLFPATRPLTAALTAIAFCWAVELLQLTPVPALLCGRSVIARLVLGAHFDPADMLWYPIGVIPLAALHALLRRRGRARQEPPAVSAGP
ncbi:DUF2809 domain-containing protein [Actinoplanes sp. NPDC023714]|uniref:ribosomal maturation YjgA family protein n=1 Tax=Actinoplanes sp. NPDC023714 TaxID=3154322 RepID=UPI0033C65C45